MSKTRENAFDLLRVISMFMVIIVHVSNTYSRSYGLIGMNDFITSLIFNTISRISVPIFLMISGALLLDRIFEKKKYIQRIKRFLILIIVWDIIYLVWEYFFLGITYSPLYNLLVEPYRAHLWYLYVIITIYIFQPVMKWVNDKLPVAAKIIITIIWLFLSSYSLFNVWVAKYFTIFSYIGYFILGRYAYNFIKKHITKKQNILEILIIIVGFTLSVILNYYASRNHGLFYNLFFAYRTPFIMLPSVAFFAFVITNYTKKKNSKLLTILSDVSLGVYLIHGIFLDIVINKIPLCNMSALIEIPLFSILIFVVSVLCVYFLKKIKILQSIF